MSYVFSHSNFSFDVWVPISIIILAAAVIYAAVRHSKMKKKHNSLKSELTGLYAEDAMEDTKAE